MSTADLCVAGSLGIRGLLTSTTFSTTSAVRVAPLVLNVKESPGQVSDAVRVEKTARMHAVYEREKKLRESADVVVRHGEPRPKHDSKLTYYIESSTAAALRRIFEEGDDPWW